MRDTASWVRLAREKLNNNKTLVVFTSGGGRSAAETVCGRLATLWPCEASMARPVSRKASLPIRGEHWSHVTGSRVLIGHLPSAASFSELSATWSGPRPPASSCCSNCGQWAELVS